MNVFNKAIAFLALMLITSVAWGQSLDQEEAASTERHHQSFGDWISNVFKGSSGYNKATLYGHRGYRYSPGRPNKNILEAVAEYAPDSPKPTFNGAVVESFSRWASMRRERSRRQKVRQIRRNHARIANQ